MNARKGAKNRKKSEDVRNKMCNEKLESENIMRTYTLWRKIMTVLIYGRVCKNLRTPKWKVRAQTKWTKLRLGVKIVMQHIRDEQQHMLVGDNSCQECDMSGRRSKRLRDEVEEINYKQTRGYTKKVEIHEKINKRTRKQSSMIVSEIGMELCEWMTLSEKTVRMKKRIG